jgi:hypothetical protein
MFEVVYDVIRFQYFKDDKGMFAVVYDVFRV